jgi:hypothetical protein
MIFQVEPVSDPVKGNCVQPRIGQYLEDAAGSRVTLSDRLYVMLHALDKAHIITSVKTHKTKNGKPL